MAERIILEGGGSLEWREDGALVHLNARRTPDGAGLYKVWLRGAEGEYLLGTLIPQGKQLTLERTLSRDTLSAAGCWPITGGRSVMAFSFGGQESPVPLPSWRWEHRPARYLPDPVLAEAAAAWGSMLLRETEGGFQLAAPLDVHRPFPVTPLFCLGRVIPIDGQNHIVFSFSKEGEPQNET